MIPQRYSELLELPPETKPEEARDYCHRLLERLGPYLERFPQSHPDRPELESRKLELEQAFTELAALVVAGQQNTASVTARAKRPAGLVVTVVAPTPPEQTQSSASAPSGNPLARLEALIDKGMACLSHDSPDRAGASKCHAEMEREAADKLVPENLRGRMLLFKQRLDQMKQDDARERIGGMLKQVGAALAKQPPALAEARAKLKFAAAALKETPDPFFQRTVDNLALKIVALEEGGPVGDSGEKSEAVQPPPVTITPPPELNETELEETELEKEVTILPTPEMRQALAERRAEQSAKEPPERIEKKRESKPPLAAKKVESTIFDEAPPTPSAARPAEPAKPVEPVKTVELIKAPEPIKPAEPVKAAEPVKPTEPVKPVEPVKPAELEQAIVAPVTQPAGAPSVPGPAAGPEKPAANEPPPDIHTRLVRRSIHSRAPAAKPNKRREFAAVLLILALIALGDLTYVEIKSWQKAHSENPPAHSAIQEPAPAVSSDVAPANPAAPNPPQTTSTATSSPDIPSPAAPPPTPADATATVSPSLVVRSEPRAAQVQLKYPDDNQPHEYANNPTNGIEVAVGEDMEISLAVPDYEPVTTNIPALQPGERKVVDFGKLTLQTASLELKVEPADAQVTLIYPGRDPIVSPTGSTLDGIVPKTAFEVVVERKGYVSASNSFTLKPREQASYDFGSLKPLPGSLAVTAPAQPFDLKVAWDGATYDYGTAGTAANLPVGKNLLIAVSVDGFEPAYTNVTLAPGEAREVSIVHLEPLKGYLQLKSDPDGAEVSYRIDGQRLFSGGVANRINNLPLGHSISVTLVKNGYVERTLQIKLLHSGDTLDFGRLVSRTRKALLIVAGPNDGAEIYVNDRWIGVKNGGTIPNLTVGQSYEIRLHKLGRVDMTRTVTMKGDGIEQTEYFPEMQIGSSTSDIDQVLRDINASIITVKNEMPLSAGRRRTWSDWIGQVETTYQGNPQIWARIKDPLDQLRALVNASAP